MSSLIPEIVEKLQHLPETKIQEVLHFVEFISLSAVEPDSVETVEAVLRSLSDSLSSDRQNSKPVQDNITEYDGCQLKLVGNVLVVKAQETEDSEAINFENVVNELREERIRQIGGW
jgi:hypothetical protein